MYGLLTNDISEINNTISVSKKFADGVYSSMVMKRYGIKGCKNILSSKLFINEIRYEIMNLSKMDPHCKKCEPVECNEIVLDVPNCCMTNCK